MWWEVIEGMSSMGRIGTIGSTLSFSFGFVFHKVSSLLCRLFPPGGYSLSTDTKRHSLLTMYRKH